LPQNAGTPIKPAFGLSGIRVLCIDNDPRILDGMRQLLEGWGCVVETIPASAEIDVNNRPNIVLADYHLDRETGLEAIEKA
jgi:CheY-like chemotaxis protein